MYEQFSLFDIVTDKKCCECDFITKEYYTTEGKVFDYCTKKEMYIDDCLTKKENLCKLGG